jgi:peroxiredoxin
MYVRLRLEAKGEKTMSRSGKRLFPHLIFAAIFLLPCLVSAQNGEIKPVTAGQPMPDFTLPTYQGEDISISQFKGKNILLIFPRGKFRPNVWCRMCAYQYADLADIEKEQQIRKKYNLEILFVLPYSREMVEDWVDKFPKKFAEIEQWKNPPNADTLTGNRKSWMEETRRVFPKKFEGKIPFPFPILIDTGAEVSKGLRLYAPDWNTGIGPMNIPAVFIIDKNGILQFKYISQVTFDRPGFDYLSKVLPCIDHWGKNN